MYLIQRKNGYYVVNGNLYMKELDLMDRALNRHISGKYVIFSDSFGDDIHLLDESSDAHFDGVNFTFSNPFHCRVLMDIMNVSDARKTIKCIKNECEKLARIFNMDTNCKLIGSDFKIGICNYQTGTTIKFYNDNDNGDKLAPSYSFDSLVIMLKDKYPQSVLGSLTIKLVN